MSDTPLTDAKLDDVVVYCDDSCCDVYVELDGVACEVVPAEFAREFERKLNEVLRVFEAIGRSANALSESLGDLQRAAQEIVDRVRKG